MLVLLMILARPKSRRTGAPGVTIIRGFKIPVTTPFFRWATRQRHRFGVEHLHDASQRRLVRRMCGSSG
jgi:hypothetical protein